jgi:small-conductance mechanosensitive channel
VLAAIKIADSLQQGFDSFFGFIPNVIGFLIILLIGYVIAKIAKTAINKVLDSLKVDQKLKESDAGPYVERVSPGSSPSHLIGAIVFWFIFLFALSAAIGALKITALSTFIAQVQSYLPNIIAAVIIFVIAAVVAGAAGGLAHRTMGDTPTGKVVRAVVPGLVLAIGLFMVLDQLNIAPQIVTITYAALIGMLALAGALAFGLGGRDVAAQMLNDAYQSGQQNKGQVKQDMQTGKERAQRDARTAKDKADEQTRGGGAQGGSERRS